MQLRPDVDEATIKRNIGIGLERLHRQYEISVKKYDEISLLDLSHALRWWVDMQDSVQQHLLQYHPDRKFSTYTLRPPLLKACHKAKYIVTYFVKGVTTYVGSRAFLSFKSFGGMISFGARRLGNGALNATHLLCLADSPIKYEYDPTTAFAVQELTFKEWLMSEVVRVRFEVEKGKFDEKIIDRATLIKRVANHLGGSHPSGVFEVSNKFDKAVEFLLDFSLGNIPLPYYILLKSAHDILDGFEYLDKKGR